MHVTNVIYFPSQDVMCNILYQWRKSRKFVLVKWASSLTEYPLKTLSEVNVFDNEPKTLNVTETAGLATEMQPQKHRKK